jgi:hypothetical protein
VLVAQLDLKLGCSIADAVADKASDPNGVCTPLKAGRASKASCADSADRGVEIKGLAQPRCVKL